MEKAFPLELFETIVNPLISLVLIRQLPTLKQSIGNLDILVSNITHTIYQPVLSFFEDINKPAINSPHGIQQNAEKIRNLPSVFADRRYPVETYMSKASNKDGKNTQDNKKYVLSISPSRKNNLEDIKTSLFVSHENGSNLSQNLNPDVIHLNQKRTLVRSKPADKKPGKYSVFVNDPFIGKSQDTSSSKVANRYRKSSTDSEAESNSEAGDDLEEITSIKIKSNLKNKRPVSLFSKHKLGVFATEDNATLHRKNEDCSSEYPSDVGSKNSNSHLNVIVNERQRHYKSFDIRDTLKVKNPSFIQIDRPLKDFHNESIISESNGPSPSGYFYAGRHHPSEDIKQHSLRRPFDESGKQMSQMDRKTKRDGIVLLPRLRSVRIIGET